MNIKLILQAGSIPDNTTVTKPTGQKPYELVRGLKIYVKDGSGDNIEIKPPDGSAFLVAAEGGEAIMEQIGPDRELAVSFQSFEDLIEFIQEAEEER